MEQEQTKETIPLWLAVAITVCVSLPFGIWLHEYSLPIWASFIVWAEYFALGAKPAALMTIVPAYILGVIVAAIIMTGYAVMNTWITAQILTPGDISLFIACFVGFCIFIYAMKYVPVTQRGSLPYFNGISMGLACYFTGSFMAWGNADPNLLPAVAGFVAILAGLLGAFLGWFNVTITFPRVVKSTVPGHQASPA